MNYSDSKMYRFTNAVSILKQFFFENVPIIAGLKNKTLFLLHHFVKITTEWLTNNIVQYIAWNQSAHFFKNTILLLFLLFLAFSFSVYNGQDEYSFFKRKVEIEKKCHTWFKVIITKTWEYYTIVIGCCAITKSYKNTLFSWWKNLS